MRFYAYTYQQQPQFSEYRMYAQQYSLSYNPSDVKLELGSHAFAEELRGMLLSTKPLMYFYIPSYQNIWFGPNNLSIPLVKSFIENNLKVPKGKSKW